MSSDGHTLSSACAPALTDKSVEASIPNLPKGAPPLRAFYLYLTTGCNLCCQHCWITPTFVDGNPSPGDCLDAELLALAIDDAVPLGLKRIKLTGGEPLIHPQFREITRMITARGMQQDMETNGTQIDEDTAAFMRNETSIDFISVSLDSVDPSTHDAFRGRDGAFAAATRGVRHLAAVGFTPQLIMSVHRGNLHEVDAMINLAIELGAKSLKFNPITNAGRGKKMHQDGTALSYHQLQRLLERVNGDLHANSSIRLNLMAPLAMLSVDDLLSERWRGACNVANIMGILGTGHMAMCGIGRNVPALCYGQLGVDRVADVWANAPLLKEIRRKMVEPFPGICRGCIHAALCRTGCLAMNFMDTGELFAPSAWCEAAVADGSFRSTRWKNLDDAKQ